VQNIVNESDARGEDDLGRWSKSSKFLGYFEGVDGWRFHYFKLFFYYFEFY